MRYTNTNPPPEPVGYTDADVYAYMDRHEGMVGCFGCGELIICRCHEGIDCECLCQACEAEELP